MSGPLAGIRVIDLTTQVLGPLASQTLGDMGADVIKVERAGGDPIRRQGGPARHPEMSALFLTLNRNKRSVELDLKRPECRAALQRLVRGADVFMHNMRPAAAEKLEIAYKHIAEVNPGIVYASASGYRRDGRFANRPAYDDVIQGGTGIAALNAGPDGAPRYLPALMVDKLAGIFLASAISMALVAKCRTGLGQEIHVPMFESMVAFNFAEHLWGGVFGEPELGLGYARLFSRRPFATSDGHICLMVSSDKEWQRFFTLIGEPSLLYDPRFSSRPKRTKHIETLYELVARHMRTRTTAEWLRALTDADIPVGPVRSLCDLWDDEYLRASGFFRPFDHPTEGRLYMTDIPSYFSATPGAIRRGPPRLGEHTHEVLREVGVTAADIGEAT